MGAVIYSASPLQAMLGNLLTILFLLGCGVVGIIVTFVRKNQTRGARIGLGIASVFLLLVGIVWAGISLLSLASGSVTVTARLNKKRVTEESCGSNGETTCTHYVMETTAAGAEYDFDVPQSTLRKVQVNSCYQVSYVKSRSPFSVVADTDQYHRVEAVTRIQAADASACK